MDINLEQLKQICLDFFKLAGMEFSLWDEQKNNIFSYPTTHSPFCSAVRSNRELYIKCQECDNRGLEEVDKTKKSYTYCCHMGLTEGIVPIMQDNEIVGYLMLGQIAESENFDRILKCTRNATDNKEFYELLMKSLEKTTSCSHEKIEHCMNTLKVLIDYMNLSYVIHKTGGTVFYNARKYILENISSPLLPKDICREIGVSTNTLYKSVKKNTGLSPTEFIRSTKIEKAKRLLQTSDLSISDIAENVGIPDTNYFIRVFRSETGTSPLKYRKSSN